MCLFLEPRERSLDLRLLFVYFLRSSIYWSDLELELRSFQSWGIQTPVSSETSFDLRPDPCNKVHFQLVRIRSSEVSPPCFGLIGVSKRSLMCICGILSRYSEILSVPQSFNSLSYRSVTFDGCLMSKGSASSVPIVTPASELVQMQSNASNCVAVSESEWGNAQMVPADTTCSWLEGLGTKLRVLFQTITKSSNESTDLVMSVQKHDSDLIWVVS